MFQDYLWVPFAFIALLVFLMLLLMIYFERRTRIRVYNISAILIGVFILYQLYANLFVGMNFVHADYLCVGIVAIVICSKTAMLERQKLKDDSSVLQGQTKPSSNKQEHTEEEAETAKDIEHKIADKEILHLQEQEEKYKAVLEWFNAQIVYFVKACQLDLRDCAKEFASTGKIKIKTIPSYNDQYKQNDIPKISSIFLFTGKTREQCANSALTVFACHFHNTEFPIVKKKIWGKEIMEREIKGFTQG